MPTEMSGQLGSSRARDAASPESVREVTMRELDRHASRVIAGVERGELAVVSRNGWAVAMIVRLEEAVTLLPGDFVVGGAAGDLAREFERRADRRAFRLILHESRIGGGARRRPG